ncbi:MAG TPA: glycoside hydrolase family 2 TIM barrel-domain containing protein [Clostridia bacterium]|nr:glycoside hydrolase family 2 TIM barrel-domain containing protein [Clostridia bacterium]
MKTIANWLAVRFLTILSILSFFLFLSSAAQAERLTVSLDGTWQIADSESATDLPTSFSRKVPVPGLANLAKPAFPNVDAFYSREHLANRIRAKLSPEEWLTNYWKGKVEQDWNYFWYQKTFRAPTEKAVAILKINKAQFGTAVWLNGQKIGEYAGCFTASYFHLENAIKWKEENTLLIRIGANPAVLPDTFPTGSDFEKIKWTPGIYDSVSLIFCENPLIETVQIAPRVSASEILIQTKVKNYGKTAVNTPLSHQVRTWKGRKAVATVAPETIALAPGEEKVLTQTIRIPDAHLWSPEDPFLYVVESSTGGDAVKTRFGMREFRFDGATRRAYLNGKVYYLRGSNITLHRFFEDPLCKDLPWDEGWVRKLLGDVPKKMHWNYFRFCIGPVPDKWLDICDEVGLLIQNEFFVWTGGPGWYKGYSRTHDADEMIRQYKDWMRDNWNHPSVAVWDANNETKDDIFGTKIIPAVRSLDLSNRPWENSYNAPAGPIDPVEDHPYLMISGGFGKLDFSMTKLETMDGKPRPGSLPSDNHAPLINEYGWLWLNRDGSTTRLTENLYPQLLGATHSTARERLDLYSYLLGAKTEFWRAHRHYAGIIHFVYLTCSYPGVYTADHFRDVPHLKLDPAFADYMGEAFKPLGVYLNFFQPTLPPDCTRSFKVMLVNDYDQPVSGKLVLTLENEKGKTVARAERNFAMNALGDQSLEIPLAIPNATGKCTLRATAKPSGKIENTISRRWVKIESGSR